MNVLFTGATGFIGRPLVRLCLNEGFQVIPCGNSNPGEQGWRNYVRADLTRRDVLLPVLRGVDCIVHAAGLAHQFGALKRPERFREINAEAARNVAESAAKTGVPHFVLLSSAAVYGARDKLCCKEDSPCDPKSDYAVSKFDGERLVKDACRRSERMRLTILRPATVYGEGDNGNVLRLIKMIESGRFVWIGDGRNRKCLIHVNDVARACLATIRFGGKGISTFNLSAEPTAMQEIVDRIAQVLGKKAPGLRIPAWLIVPALKNVSRLSRSVQNISDTIETWLSDGIYEWRNAAATLDFKPSVNLHDGLQREIDWYRSQTLSRCR